MSQDIFQYHSTVKKVYYLIMFVLVLTCLLIVRVNIVNLTEGTQLNIIFKIILSISVPLSILIRMYLIIRPRLFSSYVIGDNKLVQRFKNKIKEVEYANITEMKISWLPPRYLGGFSILLNTGQKFIFLSLLDNNYKILEKIVESQPNIIDKNKVLKYGKQARLVGSYWSRIYRGIKFWPLSLLKVVMIPLLITYFIIKNQWIFISSLSSLENFFISYLMAGIMILLFIIFIHSLEESVIAKKISLIDGQIIRDKSLEKKLFMVSQLVYFLVIFLVVYIISV